jgi:hypothetical protein
LIGLVADASASFDGAGSGHTNPLAHETVARHKQLGARANDEQAIGVRPQSPHPVKAAEIPVDAKVAM